MIISELPLDLIEKILSLVPITGIGAVRSTCKLWNDLSKDRLLCKGEAKKHEFLGFMVKNYKLCSVRFDLHGILDEEEFVDPSIKEVLGGLLNHVVVTKVFHCYGLLLCVTKEKGREKHGDAGLVVWNPYLGQTRWIQTRHNYDECYALGYDNKNHKYKILSFYGDYQIYDISSDSWRVIDSVEIFLYDHHSMSLKGNTYFFAYKRLEVEEGGPVEIDTSQAILLCFDFTRERFGPPLPLPFQLNADAIGTMSSIRDEKLAALYRCIYMVEMEIWVTTKIEPNAVSWVPFLKVDINTFQCFRFIDSFFIDEEKKVAVVFHVDHSKMTCNNSAYLIGENGYFKKVDLGEAVYYSYFFNLVEYNPLVCSSSYVPSLENVNN